MLAMIGKTIGSYIVTELIGHGGMGIAYRARHVTIGQIVAIKALTSEWARQPEMRERFINEAKSQAILNHPNVVNLYSFFEQDGLPKLTPLTVENEFKTKLLTEGPQQKQKDEIERLIGWLVVVDGKEHWKDFRICKTKTLLGRSKNCDIILDDEYISAKHAILRFIDGDFVITDLDSGNGALINDKEVAQASLHDGDIIKMGKTSLKMKIL
jgi:serine/threonine protein kinase